MGWLVDVTASQVTGLFHHCHQEQSIDGSCGLVVLLRCEETFSRCVCVCVCVYVCGNELKVTNNAGALDGHLSLKFKYFSPKRIGFTCCSWEAGVQFGQ